METEKRIPKLFDNETLLQQTNEGYLVARADGAVYFRKFEDIDNTEKLVSIVEEQKDQFNFDTLFKNGSPYKK